MLRTVLSRVVISCIFFLFGATQGAHVAWAYADPMDPRVEDVEMTARIDGSPQRYLLIYPPDFRETVEVDLLFILHGHGSDRWQAIKNAPAEFKAATDVAARRGMLVVSPDYRARTSWMGPKAEADMLQILDDLKSRFAVRKTFLHGASMGGSSVLTFAVLHPRRIDGVVSLNGTANHLEYEQFQDAIRESFGGTKTEAPEEYKKRSAELFPDRLTMPVAIAAGGEDKLVPADSVVRLASALEKRNARSRLIYHKSGGHSTTYDDSRSLLEFVLSESEKITWATPAELRSKKLIDTAIYTLDSSPIPVNAKTLADHPEFTTTHPFDGIALRAQLSADWCADLKKRYSTPSSEIEADSNFDAYLWSKIPVPSEALRESIADLKRVQWGALTDNFLWSNFRGGEQKFQIDIMNDSDWEAVEHNARMVGRLCREGGLKGILFDTEQYTRYVTTSEPYPLGRGDATLRRERGKRWIQALQQDFPQIRVIIFFAWSPDLDAADFLKGVKDFLDGMLEGIVEPGRLVHGYENTFYYGQRAGSRFTPEGFAGDRQRYESTHDMLRQWRSLSRQPDRYDQFVQVGMAAWLESDPYNLWSGWPSGTRDSIWSNIPMALATTDEYVWCWSEHCNFLHQRVGKSAETLSENWLNPYLASLSNQTHNRGDEAANALLEDFHNDPLLSGWYFDYDILSVARKSDPQQSSPVFTRTAVPYTWNRATQSLQIQGCWLTGDLGNRVARFEKQRRRFVHSLKGVSQKSDWNATFDFTIETFGNDPNNPIILGLFDSDLTVDQQGLYLQVDSSSVAKLVLKGSQGEWIQPVSQEMESGKKYRMEVVYRSAGRRLACTLTDLTENVARFQSTGIVPRHVGEFRMNEIGIAHHDGGPVSTTPDQQYRYQLQRVELRRAE